MRKMKKLIVSILLIGSIVTTNIPYRTNAAGAASHTHDANCYLGTCHTAHTSACYTTETVRKYCSGTWQRIDRNVYTVYGYGYDMKMRCGCTWNSEKIIQVVANGNDYGDIPDGSFFFGAKYKWMSDWMFRTYGIDLVCPDCGQSMQYIRTMYKYRKNGRGMKLTCSKCGETYLTVNGGSLGGLHMAATAGNTHGYYNAKEQRLVCTKEVGAYYDSNGNRCSCICDKIVNSMSAAAPEQVLRPGEAINNKATLGLYNGQSVANYSCEVSGFNPNDYSGNWQTVTLTTGTSDYPYRINASGNREAGATSVQIRVKILKPVYNLRIVSSEGGKVVFGPEGDNEILRITFTEGDKTVGKVVPEEGFITDELIIDGKRTEPLIMGINEFEFVMPGHDVLIEASFKRSECTVTFDPAGGNWGGYIDIHKAKAHYGKTYMSDHVFPMDPTKEGYVFTGWKNDKGETVEETDVCFSSEEKLYACWKEVSNETREVYFEDEIPWPEPLSIRGFTSDKRDFWRLSEKNGNGTGTAVKQGEFIKSIENYSLFGRWEPLSYSLIFDPRGGQLPLGENRKQVFYHTLLGDLPVPVKNGAHFDGWYSDEKDGVKVTPDKSMTRTGDVTLYARWDEKGDKLLAEGEVTEVNNDPVKKRTADNTAVTKSGDRLGIRMNFRIPGEWKAPYKVVLTPEYLIKNKNTGEFEKAHIFSTGVVNDKLLTFYERGLRDEDILRTELKEKEAEITVHWVLPYLSYCVTDENYEEMKEYSKINTLSGEEDFFEKDCTIKTVFNAEISDASGKTVKFKDMIRVIINLE